MAVNAAAFTLDIELRDDDALQAMRQAQRDMARAVRRGLVRGAERSAVPAVRAAAPRRTGRLARSIIARATGRGGVYITTNLRGKLRGIAAIHNYGLTVKSEIRPRRRGVRALRVADGVYRAVVTTPRSYRAQRFFQRGTESVRGRIADELDREVRRAFEVTSVRLGGSLS